MGETPKAQETQDFLLMQEAPFLVNQLVSHHILRRESLWRRVASRGLEGEVWGDLRDSMGCEHQDCRRLLPSESQWWRLAGPSLASSCNNKSG